MARHQNMLVVGHLSCDEPRRVNDGTNESTNAVKSVSFSIYGRIADVCTHRDIGSMMVNSMRGNVGSEDVMVKVLLSVIDLAGCFPRSSNRRDEFVYSVRVDVTVRNNQ